MFSKFCLQFRQKIFSLSTETCIYIPKRSHLFIHKKQTNRDKRNPRRDVEKDFHNGSRAFPHQSSFIFGRLQRSILKWKLSTSASISDYFPLYYALFARPVFLFTPSQQCQNNEKIRTGLPSLRSSVILRPSAPSIACTIHVKSTTGPSARLDKKLPIFSPNRELSEMWRITRLFGPNSKLGNYSRTYYNSSVIDARKE